MLVHISEQALKQLKDSPPTIQKQFRKKVRLLAANLRHPSFHAKKYDETHDIWQARITRDWRFYFTIRGNIYYILDIIPHPK
jgi:mRNA interferase RelE/StbE